MLNNNEVVEGEVYNHIGDVWKKAGYFERALVYYNKSKMYLNTNQDVHQYADLLRKISNLSRELGNDNDAILYEEQLDKIDQKYRLLLKQDPATRLQQFLYKLNIETDLNSLERACLLYDIGLCYIKKGEYSIALEYLLQANEIFIHYPPPCNQFIRYLPTLYDNIAMVYLVTKKYLEALIMWKKAIVIRLIIPWN